MDFLPEVIEDIIYKYQHHLNYKSTMDELLKSHTKCGFCDRNISLEKNYKEEGMNEYMCNKCIKYERKMEEEYDRWYHSDGGQMVLIGNQN